MTEDQRQDYITRFLRTTEKWSGLLYEPFQSEEAKQQHLKEVQEAQQQGTPF